jgi:hypothetical protein
MIVVLLVQKQDVHYFAISRGLFFRLYDGWLIIAWYYICVDDALPELEGNRFLMKRIDPDV